ncbi:MAG: hypothetical protein BGN85_10025 [Alphaproteobacteria bacterium 64-11]|nr:hypothetical protein [Alphaproteobacteria bacterium]OJU09876.1 MAG: hypothetical protein BGN85_10025 [Alphaproteobacteria bacterium 64-11]
MKRRTLIAGAGFAAGAAAVAGLWRYTGLLRHYAPSPYDDLLEQLNDRDQAALLGRQVVGAPDARMMAQELRTRIGKGGLGAAAMADITADRMTEVDGWILPQSVGQLAVLAAKH